MEEEKVGEGLAVEEADSAAEGVERGLDEPKGVNVFTGEKEGLEVRLNVAVPVGVVEAQRDGEGVAVAVLLHEGEGVSLTLVVGLRVAEEDGAEEADAGLPEVEGAGEAEGTAVQLPSPLADGLPLGELVELVEREGRGEGEALGEAEGEEPPVLLPAREGVGRGENEEVALKEALGEAEGQGVALRDARADLEASPVGVAAAVLLGSVEPLGQPEDESAPVPLAEGVALWEALPEKLEDLEAEVDCVAGAVVEGEVLVDTAAEGVPMLPREGVAGMLAEASTVVLGCGDELGDGVSVAEAEAHGVARRKGELEEQPEA